MIPIFCKQLKLLRKESGLSQQEFAKKVGVSKSSVNMYERGEREPSLETLESIADYFNVDMDFLLGKSKYRNKYQWLQTVNHVADAESVYSQVPNEKSIIDIIKAQYGQSTQEALSLYLQLDIEDKAEIRGEMKHMLKNEKYSIQEELKNA